MLKWQAAILNRLYQTTIFEKIVTKGTQVEQINYEPTLHLYQSLANVEGLQAHLSQLKITDFLTGAHLLCKSKSMEEKRQQIVVFNSVISAFSKQKAESQLKKDSFNIFHVIIFSSLSKCSIWPNMFKTSRKMVPSLVQFYNRFFNQFTQYLEYKFDPLILSNKYNKVVRQIKQKKLAHPELFQAVQTNNLERINQITSQNQENLINECMKNGLYITHIAAIKSNLQTLTFMHKLKANFELLDQQRQTPLFYAVKRCQLPLIQFLVEQVKVDVNHTEYQNRTPIYLAAFEGYIQIVKYLYSKGANPNIESKLSRTPLSKACYLGNVEVAQFLLKIGVKIDSIDSKGRTALHNAAWGIQGGRQGKRRGNMRLQDSPQCVELLLKAGHEIDFEDVDKFTPLFSAISSMAERSMRILISHGANLKHRTKKNQTAVFIASKYGHLQIMKILIEEYKCDYLEQSYQNYSPLAATLTLESEECSHYLLNAYLKSNIIIKVPNIFACLKEFDKWNNLKFIIHWLKFSESGQQYNKRLKLIAQSFEDSLLQILQCVFQMRDEQKTDAFLQLVLLIQKNMSHESMNQIFRFTEKFSHFNNIVIEMMMGEEKEGYILPKIPLTSSLTEQTLIKLLQADSNLTNSIQSLYATLLEIIKLRLTKVILFVLNLEQGEQGDNKGINKFSRYDLINVLYYSTQKRISLMDYCLMNGFYDLHKILNTFFNQHYKPDQLQYIKIRPAIPKYHYSSEPVEDKAKSYLMPIVNFRQLLDLQFVTSRYLSEEEVVLYKKVRSNIAELSINPIIVSSVSQLQKMIIFLSNKHLIGIDIEHYSHNNQSFICLIQISTIEQVYLIDRFSPIHIQAKSFLEKLFRDEGKIKIFHSYDNDLRWLVEDYQIYQFCNILDTSKIYSLIEEQRNTPSLKCLAEQYLGLQIRKQFQKSDWRIRPLFKEMMDYAATDAKVLLFLLLRMLEHTAKVEKKAILGDFLRYIESKRLIKYSGKRNMIQLD